MSHTRKDTITASDEWAKHLRPEGKRQYNKAERRVVRFMLDDDEDEIKGPGLTKDSEKMRRMRVEQGASVIPKGIYCYDEKGNCPYWDKAENEPKQCNGFCWFLGKGDWHEGIGELWDQCKCCGVKEDEAPEGTIGITDEREADDYDRD